jgi:integrase
MFDTATTIISDAAKGGRAIRKERKMARRQYQNGCLYIRGKRCRKWVARWREEVLQADGTVKRVQRHAVLGLLSQMKKIEARSLLDERLRSINAGQHRPQAMLSFSAFVSGDFESGVLPTLKFATRRIYTTLLQKHLLPRFGQQQLSEINKVEIQRFVLGKLEQGLAWETVSHLRHLMSKILGTAVEWELLAMNPARGVKMPERTLKRPRSFLTLDEFRRLTSQLVGPSRLIVALAGGVGLRIGEILALRWRMIDFDCETVRVEETCYKGHLGTPKTRASRRELPLPASIVQDLAIHRSQCVDASPGALVFGTRNGTPLSADNMRKRELRPACARAGIKPIDWHTLRHTHATLLHDQGTPLKIAQAQLGHSHVSTTSDVYTHAVGDGQREAIDRLASDLFPSVPRLQQNEAVLNGESPLIQ